MTMSIIGQRFDKCEPSKLLNREIEQDRRAEEVGFTRSIALEARAPSKVVLPGLCVLCHGLSPRPPADQGEAGGPRLEAAHVDVRSQH